MILHKYIITVLLAFAPLTAHANSWKVSIPVEGSVSQVLSPDKQQVAVAPTFGPVLIFSADSGQILAAKVRPTERSYSLAWEADGNGFFYGNPDGAEGVGMVFFGGRGEEKKLLGGVHQIAVSPGGRWIATINGDTIGILNLRTERSETWMQQDARPISNAFGIAWQDDEVLLVMQGGWRGGTPFAVTGYDMAHNKMVARIELPEGSVTRAWALDKLHHRLWIGTGAGRLLEIDMREKKVVAEHKLAAATIAALALAEDGYLAAWAEDRILLINTQAPSEPPRSIPAWPTADSGLGRSPMLAWTKGDLLMAGTLQPGGQWSAERRESVIAALDEAPEEQAKRFRKWSEKASQGDAEAQFTLGTLYAQGKGVSEDLAQAVAWWQKAAEAGNVSAQTQLGHAYFRGYGVAKDRAKARFWWLKAVDQYRAQVEERGDAAAASILAHMYEKGMGVHHDPMLAAVMLGIAEKGTKTAPGREDQNLAEKLEQELRSEHKDRVKAILAEWQGNRVKMLLTGARDSRPPYVGIFLR